MWLIMAAKYYAVRKGRKPGLNLPQDFLVDYQTDPYEKKNASNGNEQIVRSLYQVALKYDTITPCLPEIPYGVESNTLNESGRGIPKCRVCVINSRDYSIIRQPLYYIYISFNPRTCVSISYLDISFCFKCSTFSMKTVWL